MEVCEIHVCVCGVYSGRVLTKGFTWLIFVHLFVTAHATLLMLFCTTKSFVKMLKHVSYSRSGLQRVSPSELPCSSRNLNSGLRVLV